MQAINTRNKTFKKNYEKKRKIMRYFCLVFDWGKIL